MKSLRDIEADVAKLANRIEASRDDLPTYGITRDFGYSHVEIETGLYHYVIVERGEEIDRRSSADYADLLYWIFKDVTHSLAFSYELMHRVENQDCRRIAFSQQIELMARLSRDMGTRLEQEIADILKRSPYDDEPTKAVNRMRREQQNIARPRRRTVRAGRQNAAYLFRAIQITWRAPPPLPVARTLTSLTSKPALPRRLVNVGFGPDDQTASTPPGRSAVFAALNPLAL